MIGQTDGARLLVSGVAFGLGRPVTCECPCGKRTLWMPHTAPVLQPTAA